MKNEPGVTIIGAGPAGLMAAEVLSAAGVAVDIYDAMPSAGRKFLLAGRGGMNLTHAEALPQFMRRYGVAEPVITGWMQDFGPEQLRAWVHGLGIDTFVGSSGRVFPTEMKAAPMLRAWLTRLRSRGVRLHMRSRWCGWQGDDWLFQGEQGPFLLKPQTVLLALGGGSWPRLGSDGAWCDWLRQKGVQVAPLRSANCGFDIGWSEFLAEKYAGQALHTVGIRFLDADGREQQQKGPCMLTATGIEGGLVYALSAHLRRKLDQDGQCAIEMDLLPDWSAQKVQQEVMRARGNRSWASHLQSRLSLKGVKVALLREVLPAPAWQDAAQVAAAIKALPLVLQATRPLEEAISSAGGVELAALDQYLMLHQLPGVFCAGEMLDWEAPTGGYLLTACFASGRQAALGILHRLAQA